MGDRSVGEFFVPDFSGEVWAGPDDGGFVTIGAVEGLDVRDVEAVFEHPACFMLAEVSRGAADLDI